MKEKNQIIAEHFSFSWYILLKIMGQSLSANYVHLIFGTKHRYPFIKDLFRDRLHSYCGGILNHNESPPIIINSVADHIHILFRLSKNQALAYVVEQVKKESSKWVKKIEGGSSKFKWQEGYGAFSVSGSKLDVVKNYIKNQQEHHRKKSFREEVEEFVKQYDVIEYDEKYFWR